MSLPGRIVVIGANGQLGRDVVEAFEQVQCDVVALTHDDVELADGDSIQRALESFEDAVVVNTGAMHNVPACEADPAAAFAANSTGALHLARTCESLRARLVHVSTDYVFDGQTTQPYREEDLPRPLNIYGISKLAGEHLIAAHCERHTIVRTAALYGVHPCRAKQGLSFLAKMIDLADRGETLRVVDDEITSPTRTADVAQQIVRLCEADADGVFHATSQGQCSWHEFTVALFDALGRDVEVHKASTKDFPSGPVMRPSFSVLDNGHARKLGVDVMPGWREALQVHLQITGIA